MANIVLFYRVNNYIWSNIKVLQRCMQRTQHLHCSDLKVISYFVFVNCVLINNRDEVESHIQYSGFKLKQYSGAKDVPHLWVTDLHLSLKDLIVNIINIFMSILF